MSSQVRELMASGFGQLRREPTAKRIQGVLGGDAICDSTRAAWGWGHVDGEPRARRPPRPLPRSGVVPTAARVRLEVDAAVVAVRSRPALLRQSRGPTRYPLPRAAATAELGPSPTPTWCACK